MKTHIATGGYLFNTVSGKTKYLHVTIAESVLGRKLPAGAEVHHVNGDPSDNRNSNLVICQSHEYHSILHQRQMALDVTGNANLRLCRICGIYDNPLRMNPYRKQFYHSICLRFQSRKRRATIKQMNGGEQ